jgi:uncharacterized protein (DUF2147 family)
MLRLPGLIAGAALALPLVATAQSPTAAVQGLWLNQDKNGIVEIAACADREWCGRLVWVRIAPSDNNPQAVDNRNPAPELRGRQLCGLTMMWGFRAGGPDRWSGGAIYDPESGNTYGATMTLQPDGTLSVRGYVLVSLLGRSETWTRFPGPVPRCPAIVLDQAR